MERCEHCGANLALVGRVHRCIPRETKIAGAPKANLVSRRKGKRGHPSLGAPWDALGISRATYFRQRKKGA
jgi:hypothetical protein